MKDRECEVGRSFARNGHRVRERAVARDSGRSSERSFARKACLTTHTTAHSRAAARNWALKRAYGPSSE